MAEPRKLSPKEFRTMQLLELDMLEELDRVCRKYDIKYCITYGTLLGAVRHKGFIPWDDDSDIAMLREEYEKFRKVAHEMDPSICYFQDHFNDPEYLWQWETATHWNYICPCRSGAYEGKKWGICGYPCDG